MLVQFREFHNTENLLHEGDLSREELPDEGDQVSFGRRPEKLYCVIGRGFRYTQEGAECQVMVGSYSDLQEQPASRLQIVRFTDILVNLSAVAAIESVGPNELHFISTAGYPLAKAEFDSTEERDQALVKITSENALIEPTPAKDVHLEVIDGEGE